MGSRGLPLDVARRRGAARAGLADRARAGRRRRVRVARAAGDDGAAAARAGGGRALLPLRPRTVVAARADARRRGARPRARPSDLRVVRRDPARRLRARAAAADADATCARARPRSRRSTLPVVLAFAWLAPIVAETQSHYPKPSELARALAPVRNGSRRHSTHALSPRRRESSRAAVPSRSRRSCSCRSRRSPRGGAGARSSSAGRCSCSRVELSPFVFPHFSDLVSLSQSRRAAGFVPFAFALAGGLAVLARALAVARCCRSRSPPASCSQARYPGDFGTKLAPRRPVDRDVDRALRRDSRRSSLAVVLVADASAAATRRAGAGRRARRAPVRAARRRARLLALERRVEDAIRTRSRPASSTSCGSDVPKRAVVFSDLETSYRISAYAPVYVAAAPPAHVADTKANNPYARRDRAEVVPRARGASRRCRRTTPAGSCSGPAETVPIAHLEASGLRPVYSDRRFIVFKL